MSAAPVRAVPGGGHGAVDEAARALARLGGVATTSRRAIVESLIEAGRLQSADTLLREARTRAPGTSIATVYRTLDRLDAAGAIKRATLASGEIGYAYCPSGHHEHVICLRCGQVRAIRPCMIGEGPSLEGFDVISHVLDFYGICAECETGGEVDAGPDPPDGASRTGPAPLR
jgi:Fur family transcriptional regulator, ferric uptake regulator